MSSTKQPVFEFDLETTRGSFSLQAKGECQSGQLALLGPSGSGKSTLLEVLAGLFPAQGELQFQGVPWIAKGKRRIRPQAGMVTQQMTLLPHLTLKENLFFPFRLLPGKAPRPTEREVSLLLDQLGLSGLEERRPHQLSGGQARRGELARALLSRPQLLLLDEPFSSLDPQTRQETLEVFQQALLESRVPWILATHQQESALALAQEIGVLLEGQLVQLGTPEEIFTRPHSSRISEFLGGQQAWTCQILEVQGDQVAIQIGRARLQAAINGLWSVGDVAIAVLRPEDVVLWKGPVPSGGSARNHLLARITSLESQGLHRLVRLDAGFPLSALLTRGAAEELASQTNLEVGVSFKATSLHLIPRL